MAEHPDERTEPGVGETHPPAAESQPQVTLPLPNATSVPPTRGPVGTRKVGRYHVHHEIGRGGMGAVLRGHDPVLKRDLALKVLLPRHGGNAEAVRRFHEEAQIGGQLQHPGLVPVYELGTDAEGRPFFAMKLVKGQTLDALLKARTTLTDDQSHFLSIFEDVGQAVGFAHSKGVLHRDLKPANIMVGAFGEVQVMDWGLAKVLGRPSAPAGPATVPAALTITQTVQTVRSASNDTDSRAGSVMGTPAYMAPEQARGEIDNLDTRSDVFGLGAILCEILTGEPPYTGPDVTAVLMQAAMGDLENAYQRLEACGADPELVQLARACLAASPNDRRRDGGAVAAEVANYRAGVQARYHAAELQRAAAEARVQEAQHRVRAERRARRLTVGLAVSVLLTLCLGGGAFAWIRQQRLAREAKETQARADELAKAARLTQAVQADLDQADQARRANRLSDARAALERAEGRLTEGGDEDLRARVVALRTIVDQARKDQEMREALDLARIEGIEWGEDIEENSGPQRYSEAFINYGLNVEKLEPEEAAARITGSVLRKEMVTALDGWVRFYPFEADKVSRKGELADRLLQVAELADEEGWARRLRAALRGNRKDEVLTLATSPEALVTSPSSCLLLADALKVLKHTNRALEILQAGRRLHPEDFWITTELGKTHQFSFNPPHYDEAVRYFTAAVSLRPDHPAPHVLLARGLRAQRHFEEAIVSYEEALRLMPRYAVAHNGLGELYLTQGRLDKAIKEFSEAIENRRPRRFPVAHNNLGRAYSKQGKFREALDEFQKACKWTEASPVIHRESEKLRDEAKRYVDLSSRLPMYLSRELKPTDAAQALDLARVCSRMRLYANAVRFYQEAFASKPDLVNEPNQENRYDAACAAVQAAVGQSVNEPPPDEKERTALHKQAMTWLRADMTNWSKRLASDKANLTQSAVRELRRWQKDEQLAPVRDKAALAKVGEADRTAWQKFWQDVDLLIRLAYEPK